MDHLPINLRVVERAGGNATVSTESGHTFRMPAEAATEDEFELDPRRLSSETLDVERPAMARALLNEITGAPATAAIMDAEKDGKTG